MGLRTRFTENFQIQHPIVVAPMGSATGAALACAVSAGGGLGLVGGGYGDRTSLERELAAVGNQRVGCGFITWSMAKEPSLLDLALSHNPAAMMLSFGDPAPFVSTIKKQGVPLICQIHTAEQAKQVIECGADVIVAQGAEAGGHGMSVRGTLGLVPTVADLIAQTSPHTLLLAAGGIADGRGVAAALMLGADGVLMGTRFWMTSEAAVHPKMKHHVFKSDGDNTVQTHLFDILRNKTWPEGFIGRYMKNQFLEEWHGRDEELKHARGALTEEFDRANDDGDTTRGIVTVGEAAGLISDIPSASDLVARIAAEAEHVMRERTGHICI